MQTRIACHRIAAGVVAAFILVLAAAPFGVCATINVTPATLGGILKSVNPGDTVVLADGTYAGDLLLTRSGKEGAPITIKAAGKAAVVDGGKNCMRLEGANWVIIEGIRFQNSSRAGLSVRMGDVLPEADHVTVRKCVFADNGVWGLFTSHMNHMIIEDCEAYGSKKEHGIYHSNSGDNPIIRNNRVHDNAGNGIHINGDPKCGGDGIVSRALVERNIVWGNGKAGGSAINVTHVQDSIFRNNLLYNNYAGGIVLYRDAADPKYASRNNTIVNNTVYFRPGEGKTALMIRKDATGCTVRNNLFIGGRRGAAYIQPSCLEGLTIDNNVYANHPGQPIIGDASEDDAAVMAQWPKAGFKVDTRKGLVVDIDSWRAAGFDAHSSFGAMPKFADPENGDFHLLPGSVGIDAGADLSKLVPTDIDTTPRPQGAAFDCGCYERAPQAPMTR